MKHTAYIAIGSNIGNPYQNCTEAIHKISNNDSIKIISKSSFYQTSPVGGVEQDWFINCAIKINTSLTSDSLLFNLLNIESVMGRIRGGKWGPRLIDLDLLFYDSLISNKKKLTIPHPEIQKRNFVLMPLSDIAENLIHPVLKKTIGDLLKESTDNAAVNRLDNTI
ncbi:MAG: 2-amino-4-hydroxy-6-hydroxymethyldihydropteridine diphosphokinase [Nitrospina sp.]|nr:2-amino-4-hydroxy-6-hydroxymethyldihydropteridine diphosphokinase [Nitrospina sp.]MBT6602283.1 2-amino-4-hydroxy-6-hydroxymethyldihydropteridine diphosphokinase [Nitrospina sp.]